MKNTKKKATKVRAAVKRPKTTAKAATGVRAKAARRTADGKFTKIIFNQIGGKECLSFAKTPSSPEMARFVLRFGLKRGPALGQELL